MSEVIRDGKFVELSYKVTDRQSGHVLTRVEFPLELDLADLMLAGVEAAMPNDAPIERHRTELDRKLRRTRPTPGQRRRGPLPRPIVVFMDALGSGMDLKHVLMRLNTTGALATADALRAMEVALALGLVEHA